MNKNLQIVENMMDNGEYDGIIELGRAGVEMNTETTSENTATYCPEDNKLRLYVGRVPHDEYLKLRAEGWLATPKQACNFVATWNPEREDTAFKYAEIIEDEDQAPTDRAADRAERFAGYREKRAEEAGDKADNYDAGPQYHGYQSQALAERRATRHDLQATKAVNMWEKAEYWQRRTAGVISHALYVSTPGVRMGRIKELEADIRRLEKAGNDKCKADQATWEIWNSIAGNQPLIVLKSVMYSFMNHEIKPAGESGKYTQEQCRLGMALMIGESCSNTEKALVAGTIKPEDVAKAWLAEHPDKPADWVPGGRWLNHYKLRLAYENQMLEAQGGRAAFVEMEAGGFIGNRQILKVNKSSATGRVVSVNVMGTTRHFWKDTNYQQEETRPCILTLNIERLSNDVYRAPTEEEKAEFNQAKKEENAKRKATAPATIPLINPTDEEAEKLQAIWNEAQRADLCKRHMKAYGKDYADEFKPSTVCRMTQKEYSEISKGTYTHAETRGLCRNAELEPRFSNMWRSKEQEKADRRGPAICKIRIADCNGSTYGAKRVVVLTDKPQKAFSTGILDTVKAERVA